MGGGSKRSSNRLRAGVGATQGRCHRHQRRYDDDLRCQNATERIPIVMASSSDPVETGLIKSLAGPGGNITGLTLGGPELYGKRVELLKETVPRVSRVAIFLNPTSSSVW